MLDAWLLVAAAILLEVAATSCLKLSDGFRRLGASIATVCLYVAAFACLGLAVDTLDVGVVYAVWAGVGTALVAIVGTVYFGEGLRWPGWCGIALIVTGVLIVELFSPTS